MPYENGRYVPPARNRRKPPSPLPLTQRRWVKPKVKSKRSLPRINPIVLVMGILLVMGLMKLLTLH